MANEDNLIPNSKRTPSELREIAKKGGIASGKARREKANLRKAVDLVLGSTVPSALLREQLEQLDISPTNQSAIALKLVENALKGDVRSAELLAKITTTEVKDSLDRKEQRQRIKAAELATDEQRTRIELLKVKLDAEKGAKPDTSLMRALLDAVEGGD
ncbi:phage protein [Streptococcus pyogenes]|nr:phage protein [Streptococcus pyogenes]